MKRILIDLNKLSNLNCGLGQVAFNFGKAICQTPTNLDISFLLPKEYMCQFGKDVTYYTSKTIKKVKNTFDIWHCIHQEPVILPDDNTKLLLTIHDLNFLEEKNKRKAKKRIQKLQKLVNRTDRIAFISEFSQKVALENLTYPKEKTSVIYNGVVTNTENDKPLIKSNKFFFSIGVFKEKKNFHVLIPVMKYYPDYKLIIAGDRKGSYFKKLQKIIKEENVENQILFPGIISEKEKTWYYKNCDAFLFPSLYEGFGLPIIEAMQNGAPVITSNKSSLPEIGGGFSFIFNSFDETEIRNQINNGILKHKNDSEFIKMSMQFSLQYSWNKNIENYISIYKFL